MTSEDEEPTTIIDNCADYVSTSIFGPIGNCPNCNADDIDDDDDDDEGEIENFKDASTLLKDNPNIADDEFSKERNNIANDTLHIIPETLAKIAKVKKPMKRNEEDDTPSDRGSDVASLDLTLESRLEALLDLIDPETLDHIVVDDGKEIFVRALNDTKDESQRIKNDETSTKAHLPVVLPSEDELAVNQNITSQIEPVKADINEIESLPPQQSTFADCICPFSSSLSDTNNNSHIDVDDNHVHSDVLSDAETRDKSANDTNLDYLQQNENENDAYVTEEQKSNAPAELIEQCKTSFPDNETKVDDETKPNQEEKAESASKSEGNIIEELITLSNILPLREDAGANDTNNTNDPDSMIKYDVLENGIAADDNEIADNTPEQSKHDEEDGTNLSIPVMANESTESAARQTINPPAKWSIFNPFNTSFLDANRNDGTSNKDPIGDQLNDVGVEVEESSKPSFNGSDPVGSGPISSMITNSIDKNITPPWDREDPPTIERDCTTNSPDNETGDIDLTLIAENEETDIEQCNDLNESTDSTFDVECTIAGPVESSIPTKAIPNFQSPIAAICNQIKAKKISKALNCQRCSSIMLLLVLLLGSLSVGVYFILQNKNTTTKVVSASTSQSEDSTIGAPTTPINDIKTSRPTSVVSPTISPTVPPTVSPIVKNKPSRAPLLAPTPSLKPTNSPTRTAPDPNGTDDTTDDDNSNGQGGNDDDAATGDDSTNDDGSSVSTDDNTGTDDNASTDDNTSTDDGNSSNNDDDTTSGDDDGRTN